MLRCITIGVTSRYDGILDNPSDALRNLDKLYVKDVTVVLHTPGRIWDYLKRKNTEVMRDVEKALLAFSRAHLVLQILDRVRLRKFSWEDHISALVPKLRERGALVWNTEYCE